MKRYLTLLFVILLSVACSSVVAFANTPAQDFSSKIAGMNKISNIRVGHTDGNVRIVVDGSAPIAYRSFSLSNPNRFAVDIQNAWLAQDAPRTIPVQGSSFVQQVRISQFDAKTVRIVIDATVFSDQINLFTLKAPDRLVMDFGNVNKPPEKVQKELEIVKQSIEAENAGLEPIELDFEIVDDLEPGTVIQPADASTKDTSKKDTSKKNARKKHLKPGLRDKTIVVDAGHGGSDSGAIGKNGLMEKDITLKVALLLEEYLTEAGANVLMTRTKDVDVSHPYATDKEELQARVDIANKNDADIFLSIHIDSFVSPDVSGTSVYIYDDTRLGKCLHDELMNRLKRKDRGVKFANFYVLKHTEMSASLVELMFVSNPDEEKLLAEEDTIVQAARALFEGLRIYFK